MSVPLPVRHKEDIVRIPALILALLSPALPRAEPPTLTILAYDSFATYAGPPVAEAFEARCNCRVDFVGMGGSGEFVPRMLREAAQTEADLVFGIETNTLDRAAATGLFRPHGIEVPAPDLPVSWDSETFVPVNWGYYAFIYDTDRVAEPPQSFAELIASDLTIAIQNPHTSTTGLGLLMWIEAAYGDDAAAVWQGLAERATRVVPTWADAYHPIFRKDGVDMVLSYSTSPAYHIHEEDDTTLRAAIFDEGHYVRLEVAGMLAGTDTPDLAREFLRFTATEAFQSALPTRRWLYPAWTPEAGLPEAFRALDVPERALILSPAEADARREPALAVWRRATGR